MCRYRWWRCGRTWQPEVEHLTGIAGLKIIQAVIEDEVTRRVGPRHHPEAASGNLRWGQQPGYVNFCGQKVHICRPRVRTREGQEVELESYARMQDDGRRQRAVREGIVAGLSTRNYRRAVQSVLDGYGIEKSSVSREFVHASAAQLKELCERKLGELDVVAILIDGIYFGKQVLVVDWASKAAGKSRCWEYGREPGEHCRGEGSSGRSGGARTEHRAAVCIRDRRCPRVNPSAARSLEEGLEETLTVHRLGVGELLRRSLSTTNPIESCLSTVERVARRVKRWHGGDQALRWTATGLLEAERKFHKVRGYREMATLQHKLNPSLTQQVQVA